MAPQTAQTFLAAEPMTTVPTKTANQRKAPRHARSLRISWRMLGNRDFRYGAACLKDISTGGLAVEVDQQCRKGTVVIVELGLGAPFDGPLLLQTEWSREQPTNAGAPARFLMGCSFTTPLQEVELQALLEAARKAAAAPAPVKATPVKAPVQADPFLAGSALEKRSHVRRGGVIVPVTLCRADGGPLVDAAVVDRSLQGLGILSRVPMARGTWLKVRPRDAHDKAIAVQVQVRNCRQQGKQWQIGCQFRNTPPANVLMLFG